MYKNKILDGRKVGKQIEESLKIEVEKLKNKNIIPRLDVILVGEDKPSQTYVRLKQKKCEDLGIDSKLHFFEDIEESELIKLISDLNNDDNVNGILVQLPLPEKFDVPKIMESILPEKDVDGFHPVNIGKLALRIPRFIPCTPLGVIKLLEYYNIELKGKNAVVIGCSNIVGKPMGILLEMCETATVTICHIHTKNLKEYTEKADILVSSVGKPDLITADMIKEDAVIIDVGFNVLTNECGKKICGDIDFDNIIKKASYVTPVPGGVGPMTITMLMSNTIQAVKWKYSI